MLPSESHVLISNRSTAARSIPLMPMAAELKKAHCHWDRDVVGILRGGRVLRGF